MKKHLISKLTLIALAFALFSSCKKDLNNPANAGDSIESPFNASSARVSLNGDYSGIQYDAARGYLVFQSKEQFQAAMTSLTEEMNNFQVDKGQTSALLQLIESGAAPGQVKNELIDKSPLSSAVLIAFLNKNYPNGIVKQVLEENIQFSEEVEHVYNQISLPNGIRNQIEQKRMQNLSRTNLVLAEFEQRFSGYLSLRAKISNAENVFLAAGGDPESNSNPANEDLTLDDVTSALLNQYKEVKIGSEVYIALQDKDVKVTASNTAILNYIRTNGDIPRVASPTSEPVNGLPKVSNPAPVDPSITVEPNAIQNVNCGGVIIDQGAPGTQRIFVSTKSDYDPKAQYYWDFGDGFVSYKSSTEHVYTDGLPNHTITVTVYNSYGVGCNPTGSGSGVFQTQGTTLNVSSINGLIASFIATTTVAGPNEYDWTFGDGTGQNTTNGSVVHNYTNAGTYNVTVNITHPDQTVDVASINVTVGGGSSGGGANTSVCDHSDRAKNKWLTTDNTHKFQHRLRLKNFLLTSAKLNASVNTYRKVGPVWIASSTTNSSANLVGNVYEKTPTDDCGTTVPVSITSPGGETAFRDASYVFWNAYGYVSVQQNSISSQANAFGGSTTLSIKD